jgi:hypothetical protein
VLLAVALACWSDRGSIGLDSTMYRDRSGGCATVVLGVTLLVTALSAP